ncbi:hypothetical protein HPB49_007962 [Dermacentor silvarum]|uniref:Uncharacterized protein n=1 Tax=Dermacentor silvarum TaxID=543639 RepID=A0ACB8DX33_DERSI|nr:hypothetical protein HPB49_007962 [Dermacentor silvarum]
MNSYNPEGVRNKCDHFPKTSEEKAAVKEGFLRRCAIPGVIGCTDGSLIAIIAPKGDSGYPLDPWLLTPVPGHPTMQTAEEKYNRAHATMRSIVERCIGFLMSRFHCLQR